MFTYSFYFIVYLVKPIEIHVYINLYILGLSYFCHIENVLGQAVSRKQVLSTLLQIGVILDKCGTSWQER